MCTLHMPYHFRWAAGGLLPGLLGGEGILQVLLPGPWALLSVCRAGRPSCVDQSEPHTPSTGQTARRLRSQAILAAYHTICQPKRIVYAQTDNSPCVSSFLVGDLKCFRFGIFRCTCLPPFFHLLPHSGSEPCTESMLRPTSVHESAPVQGYICTTSTGSRRCSGRDSERRAKSHRVAL